MHSPHFASGPLANPASRRYIAAVQQGITTEGPELNGEVGGNRRTPVGLVVTTSGEDRDRTGEGDRPSAGGGNRMPMSCEPLLRHVLQDDALTRGLEDIEARMLIEWLTDWTELLAEAARTEEDAWSCVRRLCRRGRAIGRFVQLWAEPQNRGAAAQLAAAERFAWPLPATGMDSGDLMQQILNWENSHPGERGM